MRVEGKEEEEKVRTKVGGVPIGCPVAHGERSCSRNCGGGWPGTGISSSVIIELARIGKLKADNLSCGTLVNQGLFLLAYFLKNDKVASEK